MGPRRGVGRGGGARRRRSQRIWRRREETRGEREQHEKERNIDILLPSSASSSEATSTTHHISLASVAHTLPLRSMASSRVSSTPWVMATRTGSKIVIKSSRIQCYPQIIHLNYPSLTLSNFISNYVTTSTVWMII